MSTEQAVSMSALTEGLCNKKQHGSIAHPVLLPAQEHQQTYYWGEGGRGGGKGGGLCRLGIVLR